MEGENTGVPVAQTGQSNGSGAAPSQPAAPAGRTISDADWDRYQRYEQQVKGSQPLIEAATKYGFKSPEDFAPLEKIRAGGLDLRKLAAAYEAPVNEPEFDPEKVINDRFGEIEKKLTERERAIAMKEYEAGIGSEGKLLDQLAAKLAGEGADDFTKSLYRRAISDRAWEAAQGYDDGHPLKGSHRRPLGEADITKLAEWFEGERNKAKGAGLEKIAKAASKPAPTPTAGSQGNQGAPETKPGNSKSSARDAIKNSVAKAMA